MKHIKVFEAFSDGTSVKDAVSDIVDAANTIWSSNIPEASQELEELLVSWDLEDEDGFNMEALNEIGLDELDYIIEDIFAIEKKHKIFHKVRGKRNTKKFGI